ncbi:MAG: 3-deoxy-D-manno-octulosonic acid transferase [Alphaproteobacteria bacterium]|nr:3-deoxy-D-manno-octulosonic acid transferase [Alphaproteobacteria bacterium]
MFIKAYKFFISLLFPLLRITYVRRRLKRGKEHPTRFNERLGIYTHPRPEGKLFWFHGASVGEAISMLPLIHKLLAQNPNLSILVTTGTLTSAEIMAKRLPNRAFHQFVPFDVPKYARRLLNHFKPDAVLWFESELWPSLLSETAGRRIPLILINGRISDKSFATWQKFRFIAKELLQCFSLCLGQSQQDQERLIALGAKRVECFGNIKYAAMPLPVDDDKLAYLQKAIHNRPVFLISSTHRDEEVQLARLLPQMKEKIPQMLTIIVPRHPNRGGEICASLQQLGYQVAQRSLNQNINNKTEIYLADTIGEMGLWYRLAEVTFVGGSLVAHGGQNFMEPARDHNAVIIGPYMHNFNDMTMRALHAAAVYKVESAQEVIDKAMSLFLNPQNLKKQQNNAFQWTLKEAQVLDSIVTVLKQELK